MFMIFHRYHFFWLWSFPHFFLAIGGKKRGGRNFVPLLPNGLTSIIVCTHKGRKFPFPRGRPLKDLDETSDGWLTQFQGSGLGILSHVLGSRSRCFLLQLPPVTRSSSTRIGKNRFVSWFMWLENYRFLGGELSSKIDLAPGTTPLATS